MPERAGQPGEEGESEMIKISDFQPNGKGFMCRVSSESLTNVLFSTNRAGEGLWQGDGVNDKQILGTCQFSVVGLKPVSMKAKLRRFLNQ
jgi:hypothetical protein